MALGVRLRALRRGTTQGTLVALTCLLAFSALGNLVLLHRLASRRQQELGEKRNSQPLATLMDESGRRVFLSFPELGESEPVSSALSALLDAFATFISTLVTVMAQRCVHTLILAGPAIFLAVSLIDSSGKRYLALSLGALGLGAMIDPTCFCYLLVYGALLTVVGVAHCFRDEGIRRAFFFWRGLTSHGLRRVQCKLHARKSLPLEAPAMADPIEWMSSNACALGGLYLQVAKEAQEWPDPKIRMLGAKLKAAQAGQPVRELSSEDIRRLISAECGQPADSLLRFITAEPVGVGRWGPVFSATTPAGERLLLKLQSAEARTARVDGLQLRVASALFYPASAVHVRASVTAAMDELSVDAVARPARELLGGAAAASDSTDTGPRLLALRQCTALSGTPCAWEVAAQTAVSSPRGPTSPDGTSLRSVLVRRSPRASSAGSLRERNGQTTPKQAASMCTPESKENANVFANGVAYVTPGGSLRPLQFD